MGLLDHMKNVSLIHAKLTEMWVDQHTHVHTTNRETRSYNIDLSVNPVPGGNTIMMMQSNHMSVDVFRSYNVTQKEHSRVKRSLNYVVSKSWKGFDFRLQTPSVDWVKQVGGSKLGASMGVIMRNIFELRISKCWYYAVSINMSGNDNKN